MILLRTTMVPALCALLLAMAPASRAEENDDAFPRLATEIQRGNSAVNFTELREAYAKSPAYDPYGIKVLDGVKSGLDHLGAGRCPEAVTAADTVLAVNPIQPTGHFVKWLCSMKLGDSRAADFHKSVLIGLLKSVTQGKDGKTPGSAFSVVMIDEEYAFLRFYMLRPTRQSVVDEAGAKFDRIEVAAPNGSQASLYFNIDRPFAAMAARLTER